MALVSLVSAVALAAVFLVAAYGKFRDPEGTRQAIIDFGIPPSRPAAVGRFLLPAVEVAVGILLLIPRWSVVGAYAALLLLGAFCMAIAYNLSRGRRPDCHCFGQVHSAPAGPMTIARNVFLIALSITVIANGGLEPTEALSWWPRTTVFDRLQLAVGLVGLGFLASLFFTVRNLQKELTALKEKIGVSSAPAPAGTESLPVGEMAPNFELEDLQGNPTTLEDLTANGKPTLLVFTSASCEPCEALFPDLASWQASQSHAVEVVPVSTGSKAENLKKANRHGLTQMLLQPSGEVEEFYRITATPAAVLIGPEGTIGTPPAMGPDAIRDLFKEVVAKHVSGLWHEATGTNIDLRADVAIIGDEIPEVDLKDLDGHSQSSTNLQTQEAILIFWSPDCSFCMEMIDDIKRLERSEPTNPMVFISDGAAEANRAMGLHSRILLNGTFDLGRRLGLTGTPAAVRIANGKIASPVAVGSQQVLDLIRSKSER